MAQQTTSKTISEVCAAIENIGDRWIKFPMTREEKTIAKVSFMDIYGFPGVIGCIDGTHVAIVRPNQEEHAYFNRKGYHSKNVQIVCDSKMEIINVKANFGGATHDSYIWRNSVIRQHLEDNFIQDQNSWLLGDSGYPQEPWLMTPVTGAPPHTAEGRYTAAHVHTRNCVERCIGQLV